MIDELEQLTQKIAKQTQHLASLKYRARKADTREKIMLGGLVKKANCHTLPKAVLLGTAVSITKCDTLLNILFIKLLLKNFSWRLII